MKITYDKKADAAYIYLIPGNQIQIGWAKKTHPCDTTEIDAMINLDFDSANRLRGIEVMDASKVLPPELLNEAELINMD